MGFPFLVRVEIRITRVWRKRVGLLYLGNAGATGSMLVAIIPEQLHDWMEGSTDGSVPGRFLAVPERGLKAAKAR
jgi:hypothetical protein